MTLFLLLALLGHAFLWIGLVNRLHALGWHRKTIKKITLVFFACSLMIPLSIGGWFLARPQRPFLSIHGDAGLDIPAVFIHVYLAACLAALAVTMLRWTVIRFPRTPRIVRSHDVHHVKIESACKEPHRRGRLHFLTRLPLNEIHHLDVNRWTLAVPQLPPSLDGLSILHLSDLHFTGRIGIDYFREVVRMANELRPDLIGITGDITDRADCIDWIPETLGRLAAPHGVYFILGNHDLIVGADQVRSALTQCGLIDLGNRSRRVPINGISVTLSGNERPWIHGRHHDAEGDAPPSTSEFHIALSHTPDQLAWARRKKVDLLLAGHTHGGQIRIPPLGAIFSPTARGVRYISGIYDAPPTVMHVSRGVSGDIPIRWNCRPEITCLQLRK